MQKLYVPLFLRHPLIYAFNILFLKLNLILYCLGSLNAYSIDMFDNVRTSLDFLS